MAHFLTALVAFVQLTAACQREIRNSKDIQHDGHHHFEPRQAQSFPPAWTEGEDFIHDFFSKVDHDTWTSYYTAGDHLAGRNKPLAESIAQTWRTYDIQSILVEYHVLLDYPKKQELVLCWDNGTTYKAQMYEDVLDEDKAADGPGALPGFHGYSASGTVEAEYVYVGRGYREDFAALKAANITLQGKIALVKYLGPFRGVKVQNAEEHGMSGLVLFSDPGDDGPQVTKGQAAYPHGPSRQPSSIQRGSVAYIHQYPGDPSTPGRPSKPGVERDATRASNMPKIPSLPISYRDALPILRALDGHGVPGKNMSRDNWVGGLDTSYSTGPAPGVTLSLTNTMESWITPIWDVIGAIVGTNPDETIIIGNHRDAWVSTGAADPNSGRAVLMEMAKVFGELVKTGWKPRRNIVFASWDAEEYAMVGSTEWVEEFAPWLRQTTITYLNLDIAVAGPLPGAGATPELRTLALDVMKKVVYGNRTLYDAWDELNFFRPETNGFTNLGSGSDYTAFLQLGIGALDFGMDADYDTPVYHYHSTYDSFHWMKTIDPDYSLHVTTARFMTLLTYHLADDVLIPFDMVAYARNINYWIRDQIIETLWVNSGFRYGNLQVKIAIPPLSQAAKNFQKVANAFMEVTSREEFLNNTKQVKEANTSLRDVQRVFIREKGLPGRPFYKNGLYAPSRDDGYRAQVLPGSMEALHDRNFTACREWNTWLADALNEASKLLAKSL